MDQFLYSLLAEADPAAAKQSIFQSIGIPAEFILVGGIALGFIASFWSKFKGILWRFVSMFIQRVEIHTETGHNALVSHLVGNYRRSKLYDRMYGASYEHYRNGRYGVVPYEQFGSRTMVFWKGWIPFLFSNSLENKAASGKAGQVGGDDVQKVYSSFTFIRRTIDVEAILKAACDASNNLAWAVANKEEKQKNRFVIHFVPNRKDEDGGHSYGSNGLAWYQQGYYRLLSHKPDELGKAPLNENSALGNLIFPQRVKDLIKEIELWRNNRDWYKQKGIPWKRGWLLYGPPGTGKTALARAFAEDLNMPIYVYNLAEMNNHELMKAWSEMQVNVPCIALIEDIDNVFHGRENVARKGMMGMGMMFPMRDGGDNNNKDGNDKKSGGGGGNPFAPLTFDCLLNCLDGVERVDGVFTIVSTNDLSKIDPALGLPRKLPDGETEFISTRPGRIDKAVELTYMDPADKKIMAKRILGEYKEAYEKMLDFVDQYATLQETPAQFQERCGQVALKQFWKEQERLKEGLMPNPKGEDDPHFVGPKLPKVHSALDAVNSEAVVAEGVRGQVSGVR